MTTPTIIENSSSKKLLFPVKDAAKLNQSQSAVHLDLPGTLAGATPTIDNRSTIVIFRMADNVHSYACPSPAPPLMPPAESSESESASSLIGSELDSTKPSSRSTRKRSKVEASNLIPEESRGTHLMMSGATPNAPSQSAHKKLMTKLNALVRGQYQAAVDANEPIQRAHFYHWAAQAKADLDPEGVWPFTPTPPWLSSLLGRLKLTPEAKNAIAINDRIIELYYRAVEDGEQVTSTKFDAWAKMAKAEIDPENSMDGTGVPNWWQLLLKPQGLRTIPSQGQQQQAAGTSTSMSQILESPRPPRTPSPATPNLTPISAPVSTGQHKRLMSQLNGIVKQKFLNAFNRGEPLQRQHFFDWAAQTKAEMDPKNFWSSYKSTHAWLNSFMVRQGIPPEAKKMISINDKVMECYHQAIKSGLQEEGVGTVEQFVEWAVKAKKVYDQEDVIHLTEDWLAALMVRNGINVVRRNMEPLSASTDGGVQLKEVPTVPPSVPSSASSTSTTSARLPKLLPNNGVVRVQVLAAPNTAPTNIQTVPAVPMKIYPLTKMVKCSKTGSPRTEEPMDISSSGSSSNNNRGRSMLVRRMLAVNPQGQLLGVQPGSSPSNASSSGTREYSSPLILVSPRPPPPPTTTLTFANSPDAVEDDDASSVFLTSASSSPTNSLMSSALTMTPSPVFTPSSPMWPHSDSTEEAEESVIAMTSSPSSSMLSSILSASPPPSPMEFRESQEDVIPETLAAPAPATTIEPASSPPPTQPLPPSQQPPLEIHTNMPLQMLMALNNFKETFSRFNYEPNAQYAIVLNEAHDSVVDIVKMTPEMEAVLNEDLLYRNSLREEDNVPAATLPEEEAAENTTERC